MTKKIMALLLFVTSITFAQEKVKLRTNYKKGDSYTIKVKTAQVMGLGVMTNDMNIHMDQTVTAVSGNEYDMEAKITKMTMDMKQGAMAISYDSSKKEEELSDTGKMMHNQMKPMLSATITMKANNRGKVLSTKVEPQVPGVDDFTNQSTNIEYPAEAVKVGDSWSDKKSKKGMNFNYVYTVKSITAKQIDLTISGTVDGMATGKITGTMHIDRATGVPSSSNLDLALKVQGQDLSTKIEYTCTKN
ncbi:conserved exported hypothetical protein [Tenacibaculum litopenaei]|uniref:DUF6263 family protein n=1 Tax=Tenacibaculum litopenaei TaxID=396016 RepID=UPI003893753B